MAKDNQSDSDAFVTEVCWHYYINEMTQAEIAGAMGVTRLRVNPGDPARQADRHGQGADRIALHRGELQEGFVSDSGWTMPLSPPPTRRPTTFTARSVRRLPAT